MSSRRSYYPFAKPISANYSTPTGVFCIRVILPDALEHLYLLQGLLAAPTKPEFWYGTETEQIDLADIWQAAYEATNWEDCVNTDELSTQGRALFWSRTPGGFEHGNSPMTVVIDNTQPFNFRASQPTPGINDAHTFTVYLTAGFYQARFLYAKLSNSGIVTIEADPSVGSIVTIGTQDMYNATTQVNQTASFAFTLNYTGHYFIRLKVASKNASSSGYANHYTLLELWRTG